ncbi:uncharacterized protein LOC119670558 [Teleopsis dalmanni]|uniref:uncharacterized protein LOC119670558 n=1 Tax=Teleopsis dalmanni TaxID=139649 RepID=UPI0018CCE799|nr:uncharacterized protein LOC119670558 [Teleopsis dalmanni]
MDEGASSDPIKVADPISHLDDVKLKKKLIRQVQKYPVLFNPRHPNFSKIEEKRYAWTQIAQIMNTTVDVCENTWMNIRESYQTYVRRLRKFFHSGNKNNKRRPIMLLESEMLFLWKYIPDKSFFPLQNVPDEKNEENENTTNEKIDNEDDDLIMLCDEPVIINLDDDDDDDSNAKVLRKAFPINHDIKKLIEIIKEYPELYDTEHRYFNEFRRKGFIWTAIANEVGDKATKLMKSWIYLQTRYEWILTTQQQKEDNKTDLENLLEFLKPYILKNRNTVCKQSYFMKQKWVEPIEHFKSIFNLLTCLKKLPHLIKYTENVISNGLEKNADYRVMWENSLVNKGIEGTPAQYEVTWLLLRLFYWELMNLRKHKYQLQDKWYFENTMTELYTASAIKKPKKGSNTAPEPANAITTTVSQTQPKVTKTLNSNSRPHENEPPSKRPKTAKSVNEKQAYMQSPLPVTVEALQRVSTLRVGTPPIIPMSTNTTMNSVAPPRPTNYPSVLPSAPELRPLLPKVANAITYPVMPITLNIDENSISSARIEKNQTVNNKEPKIVVPKIASAKSLATPVSISLNNKVGIQITRKEMPISNTNTTTTTTTTTTTNTANTVLPTQPLSPKPPFTYRHGNSRFIRPKLLPTITQTQSKQQTPTLVNSVVTQFQYQHPTQTQNHIVPHLQTQTHLPAQLPVLTTQNQQFRPIQLPARPETLPTFVNQNVVCVSQDISTPPQQQLQVQPVVQPQQILLTQQPMLQTPPALQPAPVLQKPLVLQPPPVLNQQQLQQKNFQSIQQLQKVQHGLQQEPLPHSPQQPQLPTSTAVVKTAAKDNKSGPLPKISGAASLLNSNEIMIELIASSSGNQLIIHGPPLAEKFSISMTATSNFIREVMAIPQLHNKQLNTSQIQSFWMYISKKFVMPVHICKATWNFLSENINHFPQIAPIEELMRPHKADIPVWSESQKAFEAFLETAKLKNWERHVNITPKLVETIGKNCILYLDCAKVPKIHSPMAPFEKGVKKVYSYLSQQFPTFPDISDFWLELKMAFCKYMCDLEFGNDNKWPLFWWRTLAKLKFLMETRYNNLEPFYYITRNKIIQEIERCNLLESTLERRKLNDVKVDSNKFLQNVTKTNVTINIESPIGSPQSPLLMEMTESAPSPINVQRDSRLSASVLAKDYSNMSSLTAKNPISEFASLYMRGSISTYSFILSLRRNPKTYQTCDMQEKYNAWKSVAKEMNTSVINCLQKLDDTIRSYRIYATADPNMRCRLTQKYFKHFDEIYRSVNSQLKLKIRTPMELNKSVDDRANEEDINFPERFIVDINMENCKPALVLKNLSYAVGELSYGTQDLCGIRIREVMANYQ